MLKDVITKSPATLSRMRITLCVDDTVVDRQGKLISLTYSWFSGRHKDIVKGQNIITITIKIGPLCIRPVSKQGRGNTSKPEIFREMIHDSWYGSIDLVRMLKEEGFDQIIIHTKSSYVFTIKRANLSQHKKEIQLRDDVWGCKGIPVARKVAESPTFGKVILLFFQHCSVIKCVMIFGRKLRACEALSIWRQHNSIEQFWRRLKNDLQIHRIRLRGREGVY